MSLRSRSAWLASALVVTTLGVSAEAQPAPQPQQGPRDVAGAEALFAEGKRLMDAGKIAAACPKFEESNRLDPGVGALLNLAACRELEGKLATAWAHYRDAEAQLRAASDERRAAFAKDHATALEPRLPMVVVHVASPPAGLTLTRDGIKLSSASLGARLPVDPGGHEIVAEAPGRVARKRSFVAKEHELTTIDFAELDPAPPTPPPSGTPPTEPPTSSSGSGNTQRTVGLILGGTGIVSVVAGLVFVGATAAQKSAADDNCPTKTTCNAAGFNAIATAKDLALAADITLIGGTIVGGAGVVLFVTAPSGSSDGAPGSALWIAPSLSPRDLGLHATGTF